MLSLLKNIFYTKTEEEKIEEYLASSESLEDLERRQKEILECKAPFQKHLKLYKDLYTYG